MDATLNVRLSKTLKEHGQQVLDRAHISTTDAVRSMFAYMEQTQEIPDFIQPQSLSAQAKRQALRDMVGCVSFSEDALDQWHSHLDEKYGHE